MRWLSWMMLPSTASMTTPRPTVDQVSLPTVPSGVPAAVDLPDWLPDEATLNQLAGEFFAALPGAGAPGTSSAPARPVPSAPGGGAQAPRVDVPARASDVPQVPGGSGSADPSVQPGFGQSVQPGLDQPAGQQPFGTLPMETAGLQVASAGELTPTPFGLAAPLPSAGVPGMPASDQAVAGLPTSSGVPDMAA